MKKLFYFLSMFIFISVHSQVDSDATKALDEVVEKMKSSESWEIDFTYIIEDKKDNSKYEQTGSIKLKGDKYILDLLGNVIYYNGKKIFNYIKDANEVNILPPEDNTEGLFFTKPSNLFTFYQDGFKSKYNDEINSNKGIFLDIDLFPNNLDKSYFRINIIIKKDTKEIQSFKIYNKDGIRYLIILTSVEPATFDDSIFTFNPKKFPGVEIIDMTED